MNLPISGVQPTVRRTFLGRRDPSSSGIEARVAPVKSGLRPSGPDGLPVPGQAGRRLRGYLRRAARDARDEWDLRTDRTYRQAAADYVLPHGYKRVYCYHIRKTAGTSLFMSFMALGGEDPMVVWRRITQARLGRAMTGPYGIASNHRKVLAEGAYLFGRSHRSFERQPLAPGTFTVTILRDPVERVRSYFDYLVAGDDPSLPGRVAERERTMAMDGFDRFLDQVPMPHLMTQLAMFSERFDVSEAVDRIAGCSSVFFTEDFAGGLAGLGRRLDLPLEVHLGRVAASRTTLSDRQHERLMLRLEPEYELLRRLDAGGVVSIGAPGSG